MFCMECGTKLPDNAKFCMNCGTKVGQMPASVAPQMPAAQKAPVEEKPYEVRVPEFDFDFGPKTGVCSERAQNMVFVPNIGLFFIQDETSIALLPVGEKKSKKVTWLKTYGLSIKSLAYFEGLLYYWIVNNSDSVAYDCKLMSLHPGTLEKKEIKEYKYSDVGYVCEENNRIALYGDSYYCVSGVLSGENLLNRIQLPKGQITSTELPDLRSKPLPADWQRDRYVSVTAETREKRNYGERLNNFRTVGGYGYLSIDTLVRLTIRFPLNDPADFQFMPDGSCSGNCDMGPLMVVDHALYSCVGVYIDEGQGLWKTYSTGKTTCVLDFKKNNVRVGRMRSWWRMGSCLYIGNLKVDLSENKFRHLPSWVNELEVSDYIEDDRGGCYVYSGNIYYFSKGWESSGSDLEQFLVAELD